MKNKIVSLVLVGLCIPFVPTLGSLQTQYFVSSANNSYYPGTKSSVTLLNLEFNQSYELLIGANQLSFDWQWINFTATDYSMTIPFVHSEGHSQFDSSNQTLTRLQLVLYDSSNILLGTYWLTVANYISNANFSGWASYAVTVVLFLFSGFIFIYVLLKYVVMKLI